MCLQKRPAINIPLYHHIWPKHPPVSSSFCNFTAIIITKLLGVMVVESVRNLYITYERYIFRYLYSLTLDYHQAEELTQETFLRVVKSLPRFRQDSHVSTWLYGIARNVYLEWIRKKPKLLISLDEETQKAPYEKGAQLQLENLETGMLLRDILKKMPDQYREVLLLRDWQGFSYEGISVITGRSISWVKVTIFRARKAFKIAYSEEGAE